MGTSQALRRQIDALKAGGGAVDSLSLPAQLQGTGGAIPGLNLLLNTAGNISNAGSITSAGNLVLVAGGSISNAASPGAPTPVLQAATGMTLTAGKMDPT